MASKEPNNDLNLDLNDWIDALENLALLEGNEHAKKCCK